MFAQHQRELFVGFFGEQLVACKNPSNVAQFLSLENELHSSIGDGGICDREEKNQYSRLAKSSFRLPSGPLALARALHERSFRSTLIETKLRFAFSKDENE